MALIAIVNSLGLVASAGVGVAEKLCNFIMLVPSAAMQALSAFVGQNVGAGRPDRAKTAMLWGMAVSFGFSLVLAWLSYFHGDWLARILTKTRRSWPPPGNTSRPTPSTPLLTAFLFCFLGYFNGWGRTGFVLIQGLTGSFLIRIPISYLMSRMAEPSLFLVGLGTPISSLIPDPPLSALSGNPGAQAETRRPGRFLLTPHSARTPIRSRGFSSFPRYRVAWRWALGFCPVSA